MQMDLNELTLAETEYLETAIGVSLDQFVDPQTKQARIPAGVPQSRVMRVFLTIVMRRDNPSITDEEIGAMKLSAVPEFVSGGDIPPPVRPHSA